jgi:hypothetical protein
MNKSKWLAIAEIVDSLRVIPRIFLFISLAWAIQVTWDLIHWYTHLPTAERGIEATGFASVAFAGVLTYAKMVFSSYSANGRDWNATGASTSTVVATTTTQGPAP